jgi:hypothetical protein
MSSSTKSTQLVSELSPEYWMFPAVLPVYALSIDMLMGTFASERVDDLPAIPFQCHRRLSRSARAFKMVKKKFELLFDTFLVVHS